MEHLTYGSSLQIQYLSSRTNPVISAIIRKLNHHAIDNGDVKIPTSYFLVGSKYESVTDPYTTLIKSIDDD